MLSELHPNVLLRAYAMGIFPMGSNEGDIRWYSPDPRCIIDLTSFRAPRRLSRTYRKGLFDIRVDSAWEEVIRACSAREETWITPDIIESYTALHQLGFAHTVEAFKDGELVGGLYGVSLGGAFMGESMFHTITDASKVCLVYLVERLQKNGYVLLDCQYMTDHLRSLGAILIPRVEYLKRLAMALTLRCKFA